MEWREIDNQSITSQKTGVGRRMNGSSDAQKREYRKNIYFITTKTLLFLLAVLITIDVMYDVNPIGHEHPIPHLDQYIDYGLVLILIPLLFLAIIQKKIFEKYNAELDHQDSFLQTVLENMVEPVVACDANGEITYYNHKARDNVKAIQSEVGLKTIEDWEGQNAIFSADGRPLKGEDIPIFKVYREGKLENYEVRLRTKDQNGIFLANGKQMKDEKGNLLGAVVVLHDITEQRNTQNQLIETGQRYQSLLDHNLDMIYEFDLQGRFVSINKATEKISGYSLDELYQKRFTDYSLREHINEAEQAYQDALQGKGSTFEHVIYHKKGYLIHLSITIVPIVIDHQVTGVYGIARDITKNKRIEENMMYMAYHDMLTGLPNRLLFQQRVQKAIDTANEKGNHFAVLFLDLDRFKFVNDTYGHIIGDRLLKSVSARLLAILDHESTVSRQGGDEFIILLDHHDREGTEKVAKTILKSLSLPFYIDDLEFFMKASIGISLYPFDGTTIDTLIKNADTAMYQAKDQGKNGYQFYKRDMNEEIAQKMLLEKRLYKALEKNEFMVYYQPKINIKENQVVGFEALIRWKDKELGMIPPVHFIPLAEENGLIIPITEWVLESACTQIKKWENAGFPKMSVSVNISALHFSQQNIDELVTRVLKKTGMDADCLQLEITESVTQRKEVIQDTLKRLKEIGVNVSIDDFGTGYSSLSYLKDLPIYELKIDKTFVDGILRSKKEAAILQTIITLGHSLGLNVVAEGVETREQLELLRDYGCDEVQGYYYSPPIPAHEINKCNRNYLFPDIKILQKT